MPGAVAQTLDGIDRTTFLFTQYGRNALEIVMKSIVNLDSPMVSPPPDFPGDFFKGKAVTATFWSFSSTQKMEMLLEL